MGYSTFYNSFSTRSKIHWALLDWVWFCFDLTGLSLLFVCVWMFFYLFAKRSHSIYSFGMLHHFNTIIALKCIWVWLKGCFNKRFFVFTTFGVFAVISHACWTLILNIAEFHIVGLSHNIQSPHQPSTMYYHHYQCLSKK